MIIRATLMYRDRTEAGQALAARLGDYAGRADTVVLALPRGGVPVGYEVARELRLPLDVFVVRKLGTPGQPELAMGAIASGGVHVLNREVVDTFGIPEEVIDAATAAEQAELERRERQYRGERPPLDARGKIVILVDDGLATGSTMRAAAAALRQEDAAKIVVAVPVAAAATCELLRAEVDEIVCGATPEPFFAVGQWYRDFSQTTDEEVHDLLERAGAGVAENPRPSQDQAWTGHPPPE
jgi:putative phosphoribosyl transferase